MFVDASAIVAILTEEQDGRALAERLQRQIGPKSSGIAVYEASLAIRRKRGGSLSDTRSEVGMFLKEAGIVVVPITIEDADRALLAFEKYGKGSGHPARLNMGDCFTYAVARNHDLPLLYKGNDFALTDLAEA